MQLAADLVIGNLGASTTATNPFPFPPACRPTGENRFLREKADLGLDHSVARCIRGTPRDAPEAFRKGERKGKETPRGDRGAHGGRAEAVRRVDHTRRRFGPISLSLPCAQQRCACVLISPPLSRINHHRAARASQRVDGTPQGVHQDKTSVGHLRGRDSPRASRV